VVTGYYEKGAASREAEGCERGLPGVPAPFCLVPLNHNYGFAQFCGTLLLISKPTSLDRLVSYAVVSFS
jgi:hypothetical protein